MQFSNAVQSNLEAFASNMKMPFTPQQDGSLSFLLSESGELTFTPVNQGHSLVVSLGRAATSHSMNRNEAFLRKAGFRPELGNNLHAARSKDGMAHLAVSYNAVQLSPALLEQTVDFLIAEMDKL
ncbi:hypothetical protein [Pseudovibrio sp. Tun.PSC04-5.I4]|uniref:hypothetical protein n=1 Tax=Pseudovibrio sp. Tun.PSC04-5.I4 TaxID=1798213 RepID=UPI00088C945A|nr:hypothetical protein [Pseudovibrio sp. Tun.PSC04-5.I4]SDR15186.1 hypothetical protein SAMN04515695_3039 [Pseudovibrio sp. Tun.PSC04-5.I4]